MRTDRLIEMLGTNLEPVKQGELRNPLVIALAVGAVAAICLMLAIFGVPASPLSGEGLSLRLLALAFTLALVCAGARLLVRSARPISGLPARPRAWLPVPWVRPSSRSTTWLAPFPSSCSGTAGRSSFAPLPGRSWGPGFCAGDVTARMRFRVLIDRGVERPRFGTTRVAGIGSPETSNGLL